MSDLDSLTLTLPCGKCGKEFEKSIGWLKVHDEFTCDCGGVLRIERQQLLDALKAREDVIDRIRRSLRK